MSRARLNKIVFVAMGIIILSGIGLFLFLNNNSKNDSTQNTVRYAAPMTIAAAPVYVAQEMGFWRDAGVDVEVTYFNSGREALDALLSNNAELMSVSETPPLRAYLNGSDIKVFATVTEHKEAKITVRTDRIKTPDDVRGKKIGTNAGTNSDYYMYRWLELNNIKTDEVTIVQLDAPSMVTAFVNGDIDVMFAWEPHNFNAYSQIPEISESWPTEIYNGRHTIVMNTPYLNEHQDVAQRIIEGFLKAEEYIRNNPEESKKIVQRVTGVSDEVINQLWDEYTYRVQLDNDLLDILNSQADWILSSDGRTLDKDLNDLLDSRPLKSVDSGLVGDKIN